MKDSLDTVFKINNVEFVISLPDRWIELEKNNKLSHWKFAKTSTTEQIHLPRPFWLPSICSRALCLLTCTQERSHSFTFLSIWWMVCTVLCSGRHIPTANLVCHLREKNAFTSGITNKGIGREDDTFTHDTKMTKGKDRKEWGAELRLHVKLLSDCTRRRITLRFCILRSSFGRPTLGHSYSVSSPGWICLFGDENAKSMDYSLLGWQLIIMIQTVLSQSTGTQRFKKSPLSSQQPGRTH